MKITKKEISFEVKNHVRERFWGNVNDDLWEPNTFKNFDRYLSKDRCYFDVGAWIGPTCLYGTQLSKECYAFEPDLEAYKELAENAGLNSFDNLWISSIAIGARSGKLSIGPHTEFGDSMTSILWQEKSKQVNAISLSEIGVRLNPNFIKMDIEGGESFVLSTAKDYLEAFQPTLYLSLHTPWFTKDSGYIESIADVMSIYPYLYDDEGNEITVEDIKKIEGFVSIIGTYEKPE